MPLASHRDALLWLAAQPPQAQPLPGTWNPASVLRYSCLPGPPPCPSLWLTVSAYSPVGSLPLLPPGQSPAAHSRDLRPPSPRHSQPPRLPKPVLTVIPSTHSQTPPAGPASSRAALGSPGRGTLAIQGTLSKENSWGAVYAALPEWLGSGGTVLGKEPDVVLGALPKTGGWESSLRSRQGSQDASQQLPRGP